MSAEIAISPRSGRVGGAPGTKAWAGRNHPALGRWLISTVLSEKSMPIIADPMVGVGYLWSDCGLFARRIFGCEISPVGVEIARANGIHAEHGSAETWSPPCRPDMVAFSPSYPTATHNAGATKHQMELTRKKHLQAMQQLTQPPCMTKVFRQIATYCPAGPVAVIARNYIRKGLEIDWVSDLEVKMVAAGYRVGRFWRPLLPSAYQQWKVSRDSSTPWIKREWILVGRGI